MSEINRGSRVERAFDCLFLVHFCWDTFQMEGDCWGLIIFLYIEVCQ